MSDGNDKLKEKPVKVVNEIQLTQVAESSVNSVAELFIRSHTICQQNSLQKMCLYCGYSVHIFCT
jgi:hypothetical protein